MGEAGNKVELDRIEAVIEDNRDCRRRCLGGQRRGAAHRRDHGDTARDEIGRQYRQTCDIALRPARLDRDILAVPIARLGKTLPETLELLTACLGRADH